jgi:hypothetical protein
VVGSLELGSLTALPLRAQVHLPLFLKPFPFSRTLSSLALPSWRRRVGERRRRTSTKYARPFLFASAVRDGAPRTLTKLFVFGSESSYNMLPTNFDFVCKNYRVYMCTPMSYAGSAPAHDTAGSCYAPCMRGVRSYASMAYP